MVYTLKNTALVCWFSHISVHKNHLKILLRCRFLGPTPRVSESIGQIFGNHHDMVTRTSDLGLSPWKLKSLYVTVHWFSQSPSFSITFFSAHFNVTLTHQNLYACVYLLLIYAFPLINPFITSPCCDLLSMLSPHSKFLNEKYHKAQVRIRHS